MHVTAKADYAVRAVIELAGSAQDSPRQVDEVAQAQSIPVSFLARHNPLVIPPVAILLGGLVASGGLIQRRMDLPDATVLVLQGLIFVVLLTSETLYGRFAIFRPGSGRGRK